MSGMPPFETAGILYMADGLYLDAAPLLFFSSHAMTDKQQSAV